ncbi:zinc finger MYM-type protein 4 isoform X2 [Musca domestica]|uniref:Zinc finger MYM-type protein 4 isoform X2 n=1 Tax=Musca domestica TaxID=7370 RepID=A0ABM3UU07_MUSDO|nr:zinc finger MYM-type protein 4 isoform X2 [Musca domestica]
MEEISSLDSFQTDEANSSLRPESETTTQQSAAGGGGGDAADGKEAAAAAAQEEPVTESGETAKDNNTAGEDFDQISEGTFEVDEDNSQATSAGGGGGQQDQQQQEENTEDGGEHTGVEEATGGDEGGGSNDNTESQSFEQFDPNVATTNATGGEPDESDMLGEADNTLPIAQNNEEGGEGDGEAQGEEEGGEGEESYDQNAMDVDDHAGEDDNDDREKNTNDVDDQDDEDMETLQQECDEEEKSQNENNDEEPKENAAATDATNDGNNDKAKEAGNTENNDAEDDVENVQEPEESDVCLIPDDTESTVTDAEKEQAILARENAEKDTPENAKENDKEAEEGGDATAAAVDKENEEEDATEKSNVPESNAQATKKAGAEAEVVNTMNKENQEERLEDNQETNAVDPEEPLLEEMHSTSETGSSTKTIISWIVTTLKTCAQCKEEKMCGFRFRYPETTEVAYLCDQDCCTAFLDANTGKYFIRRKKFLVEELNTSNESDKDDEHTCLQCKESKACKYFFKQDEDTFYVCNDDCFNLLSSEEPDKFKLKRHSIRVRNIGATTISNDNGKKSGSSESRVVARTGAEAEAARLERAASFVRRCADCFSEITLGDKNLMWETMDFCNEICLGKYQRTIGANCQTCHGDVPHPALGKYCVRFGFDIRQFCCAACLNEFKKGLKTCSCCQKDISSGNEGFLAPVGDKEQFKDFCSQACMRRYDSIANPKKKLRNDICAVCNNDKPVRVEIILDDKEHNFCSNPCFSAFKFVSNIVADQCGMCCKYFERKATESFTIYSEKRAKVFCTRVCLNIFIVVNRRIVSCQWCKVKKYNFDMILKQQDNQEIQMCSLNCLTLYGVSINAFSRTVTKCDNCNTMATPQYHLTMSDASMRNFCTYQCVMQFQSQFARAPLTLESDSNAASTNVNSSGAATSTNQKSSSTSGKHSAPFPTGLPKRVKLKGNQQQKGGAHMKLPSKQNSASKQKLPTMPVISTVSSLASGETETMIGNVTVRRTRIRGRKTDSPTPSALPPTPPPQVLANNQQNQSQPVLGRRQRKAAVIDRSLTPSPPRLAALRKSERGSTASSSTSTTPALSGGNVGEKVVEKVSVQTETKIVAVPPLPPVVRNVQTSCKPQTITVGFQTEPKTNTVGTQTDKDYSNKVLIPVPVPIFLPQPMYMYSAPFPVPVPIPLPIPVPIFIPTTRNSAQGIMKEIKKIQDKMPADPFEAELLMMAEMVAEEKRESDSDSEDEVKPDPAVVSLQYNNSVQPVDVANNSYGEDVLQMALKMATGDYDQPTSTIDLESAVTANTITNPPPGIVQHDDSMSHMSGHHMQQQQQAHHIMDAQRGGRGRKRGAVVSLVSPRNSRSPVKRQRIDEMEPSPQPPPQPMQPVEKPDANMCLKFTFGVNAWKQWVMTKNADIEKSSMRRRPFKTELLQMTADELNYSLCLFVKEVRKPNGTEYAPDTIYYLVLGIQQYLYENGRIDNIFTDTYYERFTDCLDEVARKFSVLYNDSQYIVTRVEEEHLWECKQLGAHSPHVLLSTLMFFNTKHFNLTTVEEHMQLSFSHIMKHWKRTGQTAKTPGSRNVLLRFYPPQAGLANPRKKKVYEQQENEENPLRCPVRLYEFYLSKCPESVKTRNDVFYLQPERSCVPDSPVWYSTQPLSQESLQKMLHRVKMVKEINIALLTS